MNGRNHRFLFFFIPRSDVNERILIEKGEKTERIECDASARSKSVHNICIQLEWDKKKETILFDRNMLKTNKKKSMNVFLVYFRCSLPCGRL